ncbi:MAG: hypothetical protein GPW18_00055 [Euryarchaeota archaeon]|nr:hypothetical protein [Euryarchaeota archaeon]
MNKKNILYYFIDGIISFITLIIGIPFIISHVTIPPYGIGETIITLAIMFAILYFTNKTIIKKVRKANENIKEKEGETQENAEGIKEIGQNKEEVEENSENIEEEEEEQKLPKYVIVKMDDSWKHSKIYMPETNKYKNYKEIPEAYYSDITTWDTYNFFFALKLFDPEIEDVPYYEFMKRNIIKMNDKDYRYPRFSYLDLPHPNELLDIFNDEDNEEG